MVKKITFKYLIVILLGYFIFIHHYLSVIYVDTVIVAILIIMLGFIVNKNDSIFLLERNNLIIVGIIIWLLFGISYSKAPEYGLTKTYKFAAFYLLSFFSAKTITRDSRLYIKTIIVFLVLMILDFSFTTGNFNNLLNQISTKSRLEEFGGNSGFTSPIEAARYVAFAIILIIIAYKEKIFEKFWNYLSYCLIGIGIVFLVLLGSKGPILSMLLAVSILTVFYSKSRLKSIFIFAIPIVIIFIIFFFQEFILSTVPGNISDYFYNRYFNIEKFSDRPDLFALALNNLDNYLLGEGTGSFGYLFYGFDKQAYPHNIIIELIYENGIIGLLLFLSVMFSTLLRSISIKTRINRVLFTTSILFFFFSSMTSGDISGNPILFISIVYANYSYLDANSIGRSNVWTSFETQTKKKIMNRIEFHNNS